MMSFLSLMSDIFGYLYQLLRNSKVAAIIGVDLFWALFGFFAMWVALNIFVFRPIVNPGSLLSVMPRSESPERDVQITQKYFIRHTKDENGGFKTVKTRQQITRTPDGSTYTESWDE